MAPQKIEEMTYEEKEARLEEILTQLDNSQTPMDQLAQEAKEAAALITLMNQTLKKAKQEITEVVAKLEEQKSDLVAEQLVTGEIAPSTKIRP
jgi:exodeoxyribonuclease VII small subunit